MQQILTLDIIVATACCETLCTMACSEQRYLVSLFWYSDLDDNEPFTVTSNEFMQRITLLWLWQCCKEATFVAICSKNQALKA